MSEQRRASTPAAAAAPAAAMAPVADTVATPALAAAPSGTPVPSPAAAGLYTFGLTLHSVVPGVSRASIKFCQCKLDRQKRVLSEQFGLLAVLAASNDSSGGKQWQYLSCAGEAPMDVTPAATPAAIPAISATPEGETLLRTKRSHKGKVRVRGPCCANLSS